MKKSLSVLAVLVVLTNVYAQFSADIITSASELDGGRWEYSYDIANTGTQAIEELTIWFDYSGYTNFAITTINAGGWNQIIIAPDAFTLSGAGYDILNLASPLAAGASLSGFSVAFDYNGTEPMPALVQTFEIINPVTFATQYTSQTVPEPATLALLAIGGLAALRKQRN